MVGGETLEFDEGGGSGNHEEPEGYQEEGGFFCHGLGPDKPSPDQDGDAHYNIAGCIQLCAENGLLLESAGEIAVEHVREQEYGKEDEKGVLVAELPEDDERGGQYQACQCDPVGPCKHLGVELMMIVVGVHVFSCFLYMVE